MFEHAQAIKFGHSTWTEFKKYLDGTYSSLAFQFQDSSDYYKIITEPYAGMQQTYDMLKDSGSDQIDFETNFKNLSPRKPGSLNIISIQGISGGTPVSVSGSITTTNISVSNVNSTPPSGGTYIAALVSSSSPSYTSGNMSPLSITTSGALRIDGSSVTQPISGTVTANAGTGVFNVIPNSPIATDYLPVRLTNGSSFYEASSGSGSTLSASFIAYAQDVQVGNNKSMFSIVNNSGLIVKIRKIYVINTLTSTTVGTDGEFNILRISNHSGGTLITPSSYDTNDTLNTSITCRTSAVVTSESNLLSNFKWSTDEWKSGALDQEGYDHAQQLFNPIYNGESNFLKPITLRNSQGINIKFITNSTNGVFNIVVAFTQE